MRSPVSTCLCFREVQLPSVHRPLSRGSALVPVARVCPSCSVRTQPSFFGVQAGDFTIRFCAAGTRLPLSSASHTSRCRSATARRLNTRGQSQLCGSGQSSDLVTVCGHMLGSIPMHGVAPEGAPELTDPPPTSPGRLHAPGGGLAARTQPSGGCPPGE